MSVIMKPSLATICLTVVTACGGSDGGTPGTDRIHFSDVLCPKQSYTALRDDAENLVITSEQQFAEVWADINYQGTGELPSVDYSEGSLILVYGGARGTSNEWLTITEVQSTGNGNAIVSYDDFSSNFEGCGGDTAIAYPFCIVQTNVPIEEAEFRPSRRNSCEGGSKPDLN